MQGIQSTTYLFSHFYTYLYFPSRIEGVFYRIRQKLQLYNMEPVTATIKDYVAGAKVNTVTSKTSLCIYSRVELLCYSCMGNCAL